MPLADRGILHCAVLCQDHLRMAIAAPALFETELLKGRERGILQALGIAVPGRRSVK
jgi:hypothetical protein